MLYRLCKQAVPASSVAVFIFDWHAASDQNRGPPSDLSELCEEKIANTKRAWWVAE